MPAGWTRRQGSSRSEGRVGRPHFFTQEDTVGSQDELGGASKVQPCREGPGVPPSILHWARTPHTHHYPTHNASGVSSSATSDSESQAQRPGGPLPLSLLPGMAPGGRGSLACPPAPSQPEGGHACGKGLSKQATRARTIQRVRPSPQCDGRSSPYPEHSGRGQHWVWRNWPAFALGRRGSSHPGPPTLGQRLLWGPQPGPWP